jgi:hypothetical protein
MKTRPRLALLVLLSVYTMPLPAIETESLSLRQGGANDGKVTISRDAPGNLLFDDAFTSPPVSLATLRSAATDHGALQGLADDDHPQYLDAARHGAAHGALQNNALPVSGDVNGNQSLGAHVADGRIHLDRQDAEAISGAWNFTNRLDIRGGAVSLGESQYGTAAAVGFADGVERAEMTYEASGGRFALNRPLALEGATVSGTLTGRVGSVRAGEIEGFALLEGIAPQDLLSSTRQESVSGRWTFLGGAEVEGELRLGQATLEGLPSVRYTARNGGAGSIDAGDAVRWKGISGGVLEVEALTTAMGAATPFAGIAVTSAGAGNELVVARGGVVAVNVSGSFSAGEELTWDGSGADNGTERLGFALEGSTGTGSVRVMLSGKW